MEIFIQLLDELDDLLCATAMIWNRLSRAALSSALLISLGSSATHMVFGSSAWMLLPVAAAAGCIAVWTIAALAQLFTQTRDYQPTA